MWGRWYLPMFLFRDGLLTLMYKASLMALMRFCSSLPTMLKFSIETWWPVVLKWSKIGEGALRCSLNLSPNVLDDSLMYSFFILFMENFEEKAKSTAPHPPYFWRRFVDDTFNILESSQKRAFLDHINSIDQHIQFTCEEQREDESIPFLDVLVIPNEDGSLNSTVFRKPTHTDLYLQWDRHHTLPSKYSVIGTMLHRAKTICPDPQLLKQEEDHLYKALSNCKYPAWALNRIKMKTRNPTKKRNNNNQKNLEMTPPRNLTSLFHAIEGSVKVSRKHAITMGCRCISREVQPSKTSWWLPRTKILWRVEVESSTDLNVTGWSVMMNT